MIPAAGAVYNTVVNQVTIIIHLLSVGDVNMSRMSTARALRVRLQLAGADNLVQLRLIQHHSLFARFDVLCGADFFSVLSMIFSSLLCYFFVTCIRYHMNHHKSNTHCVIFYSWLIAVSSAVLTLAQSSSASSVSLLQPIVDVAFSFLIGPNSG